MFAHCLPTSLARHTGVEPGSTFHGRGPSLQIKIASPMKSTSPKCAKSFCLVNACTYFTGSSHRCRTRFDISRLRTLFTNKITSPIKASVALQYHSPYESVFLANLISTYSEQFFICAGVQLEIGSKVRRINLQGPPYDVVWK
jgi:hypothetical protein